MRKKILLILAAILLAGAVFYFITRPIADGQVVIGIVNPRSQDAMTRGFIEGLARDGYAEGENVTFIRCEGDEKGIEAAFSKMIAKEADLIFTVTTPVTKKAAAAVQGAIPVLFAIYDPVESGVIASMVQPGGNLTGVKLRGSVPKSLEWLLAVAPETKHLFVPVKYDTKAARQSIKDLQAASSIFGVRVTIAEVTSEEQLEAALAAMPVDVDALYVIHSLFITSHVKLLVRTAIAKKMPIASGSDLFKQGVTISYGLDRFKVGQQVSEIALNVLTGGKPADIPTEVADFHLGINLKTAKASGVPIPYDILDTADQIVRQ